MYPLRAWTVFIFKVNMVVGQQIVFFGNVIEGIRYGFIKT